MKLSDIPDVLADDFSDYSLKSRLDWLSSVGALVRFSYTEVDVSVMVGDNVISAKRDIPADGAQAALSFASAGLNDALREHYKRHMNGSGMSSYRLGPPPSTARTYA